MKVTDIKQQVKREGRYSIFIDGKFSFGLSELALMNSSLRIGKELTAAELDELKDTARHDKAYSQCLGLVARRPRSEWEIRDYLKRKEYDPEFIEQTVQRLQDGGWLNDLDFARRWVESRRLLKSTSKRRLQQELKAKRVADDTIQQVLSEDETDEKAMLAKLVARKRKQSRYQDDQKLMAYLMRQGYNYGDVKDVLSWPELD
jgi:regulatory protein